MIKKNIIVLLVCLLISAGIVFYFYVLKNENALFLIADGFDKPSKLYDFVIKNIYSLSANKKSIEKIKERLEQDNNVHLHNLYIHVLGIEGDRSSAVVLIKFYSRYQHDINHSSTINQIIDTMGLIANYDLIPFLETLLRDHDKLGVQATKYSIARSLYLITGKNYSYMNSAGRITELQVTRELTEARNVILNSEGRKRTLKEMVLLDKLYRPPESGKIGVKP